MTLRDFLISLAVVTLFSWVAWVTVLFYIDPEISRFFGVTMFYAALFFALLGTFTLSGLGIRILFRRLHKEKIIAFRFISPSVRQSIWFALLVCISLILLSANLFAWWSIGLLLIGLLAIEIFYLLRSDTSTAHESRY